MHLYAESPSLEGQRCGSRQQDTKGILKLETFGLTSVRKDFLQDVPYLQAPWLPYFLLVATVNLNLMACFPCVFCAELDKACKH